MYPLMYHRKPSDFICRSRSSVMTSLCLNTECLVSVRIKAKMFASTCNLNTSHCRMIHCRHCHGVLSKFGPIGMLKSQNLSPMLFSMLSFSIVSFTLSALIDAKLCLNFSLLECGRAFIKSPRFGAGSECSFLDSCHTKRSATCFHRSRRQYQP